jgi:hypothetical protein
MLASPSSSHSSVFAAQKSAVHPSVSPKSTIVLDGDPSGAAVVDVVVVTEVDVGGAGVVEGAASGGESEQAPARTSRLVASAGRSATDGGGPWRCA